MHPYYDTYEQNNVWSVCNHFLLHLFVGWENPVIPIPIWKGFYMQIKGILPIPSQRQRELYVFFPVTIIGISWDGIDAKVVKSGFTM